MNLGLMVDDMNENFDIFSFWKENEFRYSKVTVMVRDIFSISISTVALKFIFSVGGRVIDQYRSLLKSDIVEILVCIRDWSYEDKCNICYLHN
jgi:hypothetical protein